MDFQKYIDIAHALYPNREMRSFHVCIALRKKRIISIGVNSKKSHTINLKFPKINKDGLDISHFKYSCSEWNSLKRIAPATRKLTLIVIRIDNNLQLNNSKPCNSCEQLLKSGIYDIRKVFYTTEQGGFNEFNL